MEELPQGQGVEDPRPEVSPTGETAPESETHAAQPPEPPHVYRLGDRVGLLGRIRDIHDKGNIVIEIEKSSAGGLFDTPQFVHLSEKILHEGADMIYMRLQQIKREQEASHGEG